MTRPLSEDVAILLADAEVAARDGGGIIAKNYAAVTIALAEANGGLVLDRWYHDRHVLTEQGREALREASR